MLRACLQRLHSLVAKDAAHADRGSIYLVEDGRSVRFAVAVSDNRGLHLGGTSRRAVDIEAPPLFEENGAPNHRAVIAQAQLAEVDIARLL